MAIHWGGIASPTPASRSLPATAVSFLTPQTTARRLPGTSFLERILAGFSRSMTNITISSFVTLPLAKFHCHLMEPTARYLVSGRMPQHLPCLTLLSALRKGGNPNDCSAHGLVRRRRSTAHRHVGLNHRQDPGPMRRTHCTASSPQLCWTLYQTLCSDGKQGPIPEGCLRLRLRLSDRARQTAPVTGAGDRAVAGRERQGRNREG